MLQTLARALALVALGAALCGCGRGRAPLAPDAPPVSLEAALSNRFIKVGARQALVARVGLAAKGRDAAARPPVNLVLLVDTSGSMEGRAIADARAASLALLGALTESDRLAVVAFDSKARVLLPSTRLGDADAKDLRAQIGAMKATGTTDLADGLRLALEEAAKGLSPDGVNRVVLLGDGVPNDDRAVLPLVEAAVAKGVSITALGLGDDYDETLMGDIAQRTGGRFFFVEDSKKVAAFFAEEVTRLHKVVARNAVLELRPGPDVNLSEVVGRPFRRVDRGVAIDLGDLSLGEQQEVVVHLAAWGAKKEGSGVEMFDAVLRYVDGAGGAAREERVFVGARSTGDEGSLAQGKDAKVEEAFERAKDAAATLQMIKVQRQQAREQGKVEPAPAPAHDERSGPRPAPPRLARPGAEGAGVGASPAAASPAEAMPAVEVRRAHDRAMRTLQAH
jgi:Ca-activated chloride channel family protein